jgi:signal transduction histidine kinase
MQDLSLHILDVAENGVRAGAGLITIAIREDTAADNMSLTIEDNGKGMPPELFAHALDPFVTTKTTRKVGLGLSLLQQAAQAADGDLELESTLGKGTKVHAVMRLSHIDRKPLGDIAETMVTLIQGNAHVDFLYEHQKDGKEYRLDTRELRMALGECPLTHPDVLGLIRANILEGLQEISAG